MELMISSQTKMCRICPNTLDLIDLHLPENYFIIENLESFVFVEEELSKQLPKYICVNCKSVLNVVLQFKAKISERFEEIKNISKMTAVEEIFIKSEINFEELMDSNFEEQTITIEVSGPVLPSKSLEPPSPRPDLPPKSPEPSSTRPDLPPESPEPSSTHVLSSKSPEPPSPRPDLPPESPEPSCTPSKPQLIEKKLTCVYCQKDVASLTEMSKHNKTHKDCHLCPKKYATFKGFKLHYKNIHLKIPRKDIDQTHSCDVCQKEFKHKKSVLTHIRFVHNKERNLACELCDKKFSDKTKLDKHKRGLHSDEKPFVCRVCTKSYKTHIALKYHEQSHEETKDPDYKYETTATKLYICTFCGKQLRGLCSYEAHQRIHTKEFPYECKVCNKMFRSNSLLRTHSRLHTGEKPYKCEICQKQFKRSQHLKNHKLSHGGDNVSKFECNLCGMSTVYKYKLDAHMKSVHFQIKSFDCKSCSEKFSKVTLLKAHMLESHNLCL